MTNYANAETAILLQPRGDTLEAARTLEEMLAREAPGVLSDEYFAADMGRLWSLLADGEWMALGVAEDRGGAGLGLLDLAIIVGAWGRHLVPLPFVPTLLLRRWGVEAAPSASLSYALAPRSDSLSMVPFAGSATTLASLNDIDLVLDVAPAGEPWAPSLPLGSASVSTSGIGHRERHEILVLAQAEMIGCAARLLDQTVEYARQHVQFGNTISEYQAVRHRLADMRRDVEMSRTALIWAINRPADTARAAGITLGWCEAVADAAIQLHGGMGFTWEAGLHFVRRHLSVLGEIAECVGGVRWPA